MTYKPATQDQLLAIRVNAGSMSILDHLGGRGGAHQGADRARQHEPELAGLLVRLSDPQQPGAYRADWEPDMMGPQTHYGYAFQWFSLAVALVILTVIASYRRTGANNDNDNG